jgi:hypothetical protein
MRTCQTGQDWIGGAVFLVASWLMHSLSAGNATWCSNNTLLRLVNAGQANVRKAGLVGRLQSVRSVAEHAPPDQRQRDVSERTDEGKNQDDPLARLQRLREAEDPEDGKQTPAG